MSEVNQGGVTIREKIASLTDANHHVKVDLLLPVQGRGRMDTSLAPNEN